MRALIEEINGTLISLLGRGIEMLPGLIAGITVLFLTRVIARFARQFIARVAKRVLKSRSLQTLLVQVSYAGVWVVGILMAAVMAFPGLELSSIVALLGFGSVAIGFAFQDIFKNFLAGILLLVQEPFSIGDQIIVDGFEGTVQGIALRSTELRTYQGEVVVLPNSVVFTSSVQVLTALSQRRTDLSIGVDYNTPLEQAISTFRDAVSRLEGVASQPEPEVDVVAFGDSSIELVVRYWTEPEKRMVRRTQTRAMLALKKACDRADISIPYPIRSLYLFDQKSFNDHEPTSSSSNDVKSLNGKSRYTAITNR